jgi:tetratricopeptide (TPR) repeat protein
MQAAPALKLAPLASAPTLSSGMPQQRKLEHTVLCYVLLALITVAVYLPVIELSFVTFDDTYYLTENPKVQAGLTWESVRWAFTRAHAANWHPLTWLSHMLDCQLYGMKPLGHHVTSLLFHTANTLLLFGLLKRLTGAFWRSAFVSALFALHPLHVESVAWVAERKDVLSTFFFLLTLLAYARYVEGWSPKSKVQSPMSQGRKPKAEESLKSKVQGPKSGVWYVAALVMFALGLMSKPMLVTLPFILLLLDYWPLGRLSLPSLHRSTTPPLRLLLEKIPFFMLSAASCVVTVIAQQKGGAVAALEGASGVSLEARLINTPISYVWYLVKLVWPSDLAVIYPFVRDWPLPQVLLSTALLIALTGVALWQGRRWAYLAVGWLWYLGTLVPVIGLVKVGTQSIADRYTYIPAIGLFIVFAWGVADLTARWPKRALPLAAGAAAVLAACALAMGVQLLYWQNTETLFRHTLAVTRNNYMACNNLGFYYAQRGELELAKKYYRSAMEIAPNFPGARNNLGAALVYQKRYEEAVATLEGALSLNPRSAEVESNLGAALYCLERSDEAISHLRKAIQLDPEHLLAHYNLGSALMQKDRLAEAAEEFRIAARLNPRYAEAYNNLALTLVKQGKLDEAAVQFKQALAIQPGLLPALYGFGELLIDQGKPDAAIEQFSEVIRLQPNHEPARVQLGLARASQGKLEEAVADFSAALRIQPDDAAAQCHLAAALAGQHKTREAIQHYQEALKTLPDFPEALNNLAWILAANPDPQIRNGREAVALAERACRLTEYKQPMMVGTLAAAYAETGRFAEAVTTAEKARTLAEQANQTELAARNHILLERYRSGQPARDTP